MHYTLDILKVEQQCVWLTWPIEALQRFSCDKNLKVIFNVLKFLVDNNNELWAMRKIKTKAELKAVGPGEVEDAMAPLTCGLCYKVTCRLLVM